MNPTLGKTALSLFAALLLTALVIPSAFASKTQLSVIEDPGRIQSPDAVQRATSLDETKALGADVVKISVPWRSYAPDGLSTTRPATDLSNPDNYPAGNWTILDDAVAGALARGLKVWLMPTAPAPRWAVAQESGKYIGNFQPNVEDYAAFIQAVGRRYPGVHHWSFWNEPNIKRFIEPQTQSGVVKSAIHYREMYRAAYTAIRSSGHVGDTLMFGELVGRTQAKNDPNISRPVAFLREFFCLDTKGKPLKGSGATRHKCTGFKKITASALAYHPYRLTGGPLDRDTVSKDNAPINYMKRIYKVLDQAYKAKRINAKLKVYNSEYGFQTNPPDMAGKPLSQVATYLNYSEYLSWIDPRMVAYSQYEILDDADLGGFQTGLRFNNGEKKEAVYAAFQTPMVAMTTKSANRVSIWGGVRAKPSSSVSIAVQYQSGSDWKTARTISSSAKHGYFLTTVALAGAKTKRWRLSWDGGISRTAKPIAPPLPRND